MSALQGYDEPARYHDKGPLDWFVVELLSVVGE